MARETKKPLTGKPQALKQVNLSAVRRAIREKGSATRAEIVQATGVGITTVRALLEQLLQDGEIIPAGQDASSGGRKAVRYCLQKERFLGAVLCLDDTHARYAVVNVCGETVQDGSFVVQGDVTACVCAFLDTLRETAALSAIGVGVPGVVDGGAYLQKNETGELVRTPLGDALTQRYQVPVVLENDMNAIALGFGRCYLSRFPEERCADLHMAYLSFDAHCISAGFLVGGRIVRGWKCFAGELGFLPASGDTSLSGLLAEASAMDYAAQVARLIAGVCCVLNPEFVALGGAHFRRACLPLIAECFCATLPRELSAELLYAQDKWHDYMAGMAYLTAESLFDDLRLTHAPAL